MWRATKTNDMKNDTWSIVYDHQERDYFGGFVPVTKNPVKLFRLIETSDPLTLFCTGLTPVISTCFFRKGYVTAEFVLTTYLN